MKLVGQAYWWWKDSHIDDQCWFALQGHLCTLYAPHLLYASEIDCEKSNVEHEYELEKSQFRDLVAECKEILASAVKLLASNAAKFNSDPKHSVLIEPDFVDKHSQKLLMSLSQSQKLLMSQNQSQKLLLAWCHYKKNFSQLTEVEKLSIDTLMKFSAEVEELPIDALMNLLVESIMKLVPSLTTILLRSPEVYDRLQIFL